jgi:hypothetical protein
MPAPTTTTSLVGQQNCGYPLAMRRAFLGTALAALVAGGACIASAPEGIQRKTHASGGAGGFLETTSEAVSSSATGPKDPHGVIGVSPPHGPFTGGQTVIVAGNGFTTDVRVWFGDVEAKGAVAIDPNKVQVTTPQHAPGAVDVTTQNGEDKSTQRKLPGAYTYDALYADPDTGPVSGGTVITIFGSGNKWDKEPMVDATVDGKHCVALSVLGPDSLSCTVPKGTPGTKAIRVNTSGGAIDAFDAYTYQDSHDGFKGGLGGKKLAGKLTVLAFDNFTGDAIPGAHVVIGSDVPPGLYKAANDDGVAVFDDPSLNKPVTVTVAAYCHSPITFVDVPVDTVTVYLDGTLTPACAGKGDPPPIGGKPILTGAVQGELVWKGGEFKKGEWNNVPAAVPPDEERVAFVFFAARDRTKVFQLPGESNAVYETSKGEFGYGFEVIGLPGYQAMYALAGIRNKTKQTFTAYAFGATKGVAVFPGEKTSSIVIKMDHALDQKLVVDPLPPQSGPKGPDRFHARVDIEIAQSYFAYLPNAEKKPLLPLASPIAFIGMPPLDGDLTGQRYIIAATAASGPQLSAPLSSVRSVATTTTSKPVKIEGFVRIPQMATPKEGAKFDGRHLGASYPTGGYPADLTVYTVVGAGAYWLVVVPKSDNSVNLPDLSGFAEASVPPGPLSIGIRGGRVDKFDYGKLSYRQLTPAGMSAYAQDYFNSYK